MTNINPPNNANPIDTVMYCWKDIARAIHTTIIIISLTIMSSKTSFSIVANRFVKYDNIKSIKI